MADTFPPDPEPSRRDGPIALAIAALVIATVAIGSLAPSAPHKPDPTRTVLPADDATCAEWSNGCRVCRRLDDGRVCSTPGIACTPGPQECLHRTTGP